MSKTAKTTQTEEQELSTFAWDDQESFFGVEPVEKEEKPTDFDKDDDEEGTGTETDTEDENETETETETVTTTETSKEKKAKTVKKEKEPEPFSDTETETETNTETEAEEEVKFYTTLATELKEKNIFQTVDIPKDAKITEEQFFELQDTEIENRVEETIADFMQEIGEGDGAAFIKFKKAGGKTSEFFSVYAQSAEIPDVDLKEEAGQDAFLKFYYRNVEELDEDDILDKLEWLKESGKKAKLAEKYHAKVIEADDKRKAALQVKAEADLKKTEDNKKAFITEVKTILETNDQIGVFSITKNDKKELGDYITKPTVKINGGRYMTQLQADINKVFAKENREKLLILAKLLKNDFDVSDLVKDVKTKVTKETRSTLQSQKGGLRPSSSTTSKNRSLTDYF